MRTGRRPPWPRVWVLQFSECWRHGCSDFARGRGAGPRSINGLRLACGVLHQVVMRPLVLTLALALATLTASAPASAQPGPVAGASASPAETDAALARLAAEIRARDAVSTQRTSLTRRYDEELRAVDGLKKQRASWRRDRQLREALARTLDTANVLGRLAADLRSRDARVAELATRALRRLDAELASGASATRQRDLLGQRQRLSASQPGGKKIVLPDAEIDPLADPEELEQQAHALRQAEDELGRQVSALEQQASRLRRAAELRRQHERAGELVARDDDQPRRQTGSAGAGGRSDGAGAAAADSAPAPPGSGTAEEFQGETAAVVLANVVDSATVDALRRAGRASDPAAKADAAQRARDQVAARLRALRDQRAAIEARARTLRR